MAQEEHFVRTYLISLKAGNSIIGEPYQQPVTMDGDMKDRISLRFRLLKDVDELIILIGSGAKKEEVPVMLQRDSRVNFRMITSDYSLESPPGDKADFPIQVERFNPALKGLEPLVQGLPPDFSFEWLAADTKSRLTRLRFLEGQNVLKMVLRVYVPAQCLPQWLENPIPFKVAGIPDGANALNAKEGFLELLLKPTGTPKLIISADNKSYI